MTETLHEIDPAALVSWELNNPDLEVGYGWVWPSPGDIANVRSDAIVSPDKATGLSIERLYESLLATDALIETVKSMARGLGPKGVGIAAPQVGQGYDFIGMKMDGDAEDLVFLANPTFYADEEAPRPLLLGGEGCLTLPRAVVATVPRARVGVIDASFQVVPVLRDNHEMALRAEPWKLKSVVDSPKGYPIARIAQHEIDHCSNRLFADKVYTSDIDRRMLTGAAFWVHAERYEEYALHMNKVREVLSGELSISDLSELPVSVLPQDQYRALRDGRIILPHPRDNKRNLGSIIE
ncbi:MAG TPA: peptide deformylase [Candidatus Saccharimonadia bacterium]|nr:peptide deformylase [Candidatus Saccharimonadia bacterium]